jgi:hypothetical protein
VSKTPQQFDGMKDNMDRQKLWDPVEGKDLHPSLTALILCSISGTCLLLLTRLTRGPSGVACVMACSGANLPSACAVVIRKPQLRQNLCISLKALKTAPAFLLAKWFTAVKQILRLSVRKNGI